MYAVLIITVYFVKKLIQVYALLRNDEKEKERTLLLPFLAKVVWQSVI